MIASTNLIPPDWTIEFRFRTLFGQFQNHSFQAGPGMSIKALSNKDDGIDWWFAYKLPANARHGTDAHDGSPPSTGYEFLYFDPKIRKGGKDPKPLALSHYTLGQPGNCVYNTLTQVYSERPGVGRIMYDDDISGLGEKGSRGHCKGVLGFDIDSGTGFWLLHSTPRYPSAWDPLYPEFEIKNGQTFLCISLDLNTIEEIAAVMTRQHEPFTFGVRMPKAVPEDSPLRALAEERFDPQDTPETYSFQSKKGQEFQLLAKNKRWGKDFWNEYVCDELKADLIVETWRRGKLADTTDDDGQHTIADVQKIDLEPIGVHYEWPFTVDHAKWAMSTEKRKPWVCVGDINRDKSQAKRGGGTIAFKYAPLWQDLSRIDSTAPADD